MDTFVSVIADANLIQNLIRVKQKLAKLLRSGKSTPMATHGAGKGVTRISLAVPLHLKGELERLAEESGMSLNAYCAKVLQDAADADNRYVTQTVLVRAGHPEKHSKKLAG